MSDVCVWGGGGRRGEHGRGGLGVLLLPCWHVTGQGLEHIDGTVSRGKQRGVTGGHVALKGQGGVLEDGMGKCGGGGGWQTPENI